MCRVVVPLVGPALVFAGLWTALLVFREVSMALILIGPNNKILATQIWALWVDGGNFSQAAALSVVLVAVMAALLMVIQLATGRIGEERQAALPARA